MMDASAKDFDGPRMEVESILGVLRHGDETRRPELVALIAHELRRLARLHMAGQRASHTLQTTALVNEAWIKLVEHSHQSWENRRHFLRTAARAMRSVLVDHARARSTHKRGAGRVRVELSDAEQETDDGAPEVLAVHEALEALDALDPEAHRVVELRYFGGLTLAETAAVLGVTDRTVSNTWRRARGWLARRLEP